MLNITNFHLNASSSSSPTLRDSNLESCEECGKSQPLKAW
jgi:hypothetical protein